MNKYIRFLLLVIFWCTIHNGVAQNIVVQAEYFINSDPGPGSGTPINISSSDSISQNFGVDVTGLEVGMHILFLRTRQNDGLWSIPQKRHFFVQDTTKRVVENIDRNIYQAEYFIDNDPGVGNGTMVNFSSADSTNSNFNVNITDQSIGLHYLFLRVHQDDGLWSVAKRVPFFVIDTVRDESIVFNNDIVAAEYFFDNDPGPGNGNKLPVQKGDSIGHRPWAAATAGLSVGKHFLNLRVKSEDGYWNTISRKEIFIYSADCVVPQVNFSYDTVPANSPLTLSDISTNVNLGATYSWDISADGTIEGDTSVIEVLFETTGVYPVKLTVTNPDGCSSSKVHDIFIADGFPTALSLSDNDSLFVGDTLILTAPAGYSYEWNDGSTEDNLEVTESGSYFVWLTEGNITYKSESVTVKFFNPIQGSVSTINEVVGLSNGTALIKDLDTDGLPYSISWSLGPQDVLELNNLSAGSYSVEVTTPIESRIFNFNIANEAEAGTGIIAAEYFLNTDPGPGNGTSLNISYGENSSYTSNLSTDALEVGLNKLFVRVKQSNGLWSLPLYKPFYVTEVGGGNPTFNFGSDIVYAEYALDSMPSLGLGVEIHLDSSGNAIDKTFAVDISSLSLGDHKIYVRTKDAEGHWSFEEFTSFRICNDVPASPVVADTAVCVGTNVTTTLNTTGATYNWYDQDKELIKSSVDNFLINYNVNDTLHYFVSEKNAEGCESSLTPFSIYVSDPQIYAGNDLEISVYSDSVKLKTIPEGGIWDPEDDYLSAEGIFYPAYAGAGTYNFTYSYDTLNCNSTDVLRVDVTTEEIDTIKVVISGNDWKVNSGEVSGWTNTGFNDSNWPFAVSPTPYHYLGDYFLEDALMMWSPDDIPTVYLRKSFIIQDSVTVLSAHVKLYADDDHELYINGILVHTDMAAGNEFSIDITNYLKRGQENVIAVKAIDNGSYAGVSLYMKAYFVNGILDNPDFVISENEITSTDYRLTDPFNVSTTIQNIGSLSADTAYNVDYFISSDSIYDGGDLLVQTITEENLTAGGEASIGFAFMLPESVSFGNNYLIAMVDRMNYFQEENEDNNEIFTPFTVVQNQGPEVLDQEFFINENSPGGSVVGEISASDPENDELYYSILSGNESGAFELDSAGSITIIDSANVDFELQSEFTLFVSVTDSMDSDTANITINVNNLVEMDLTINSSEITSTYYRKSDLFDVSTEISNIGNVDINSIITIDYFISLDSLHGVEDLLIHTITESGLMAGAEVIETFSFMLPDTITTGDYHLITLIDKENDILEENEGNNEGGLVFEVVANQKPLLANQEFNVDENSPTGTVIGNLSATDPETDSLLYDIISGNESGAFNIDSIGSIFIADSSQINFELINTFNLVVNVNDEVDTVSADITIFINDLEESSPLERDSLALVALYNATDGVNWTFETENVWLQGNLSTPWEGVTITNGRVTEVTLINKGLKGEVPLEIVQLDSLHTLDIHSNGLTGLPDLSALQKLVNLDVSSNSLTFEDLEPNIAITTFNYTPQAAIGTYDYVMLPVHSDTTLQVNVGGTANNYQWFLNSNPIGTNGATHEITDLGRSNMGSYHLEITNNIVPSLTISTVVDDLYAGADISGSISMPSGSVTAGVDVILMAIREAGGYDTLGITPVTGDGTYEFHQMLLQDYILIGVNDTIIHPTLLSTYYQQSVYWEEADTLFLSTNVSGIDIEMIEYIEEPLGGEGIISGYIEEFIEEAGGKIAAKKRVAKANVSIRRRGNSNRQKLVEGSRMLEDLEIVATGKSNTNGEFSFNQLVDDIYYLNIQYPGYPMDESSFVEIPIGDATNGRIVSHKDYVEVAALVAEGKITVTQINVTHIYKDELFEDVLVYPNPTQGDITIDLGDYVEPIEIKIYDAVQKEVLSQKSSGKAELDLRHLNAGIYILMLNIESKVIATYKIAIEH